MSTVDGFSAPADLSDEIDAAATTIERGRGTRRRRPAKKSRSGPWSGWLFALPALVMFGVFELYPIYVSFDYSFFDWDGLNLGKWVGLANYRRVFSDSALLSSIVHSFLF